MKKEDHFALTDQEFEDQFRDLTLDPILFTHSAHLRLAWIHITKYGADLSLETIRHQLSNFVQHVGAEDKYHDTVTIAAIKAVNHFVRKSNSKTFKAFLREFPALENNLIGLIGSHYSYDVLTSQEAKRSYQEPDVQPF